MFPFLFIFVKCACLFVKCLSVTLIFRSVIEKSVRVGVKKNERWRPSSAWRMGETHLLPEKRYCTPPRAFYGTKANSCKQNTSPTLFSEKNNPPLSDSLILPPLLHHFTHIRQWKRADREHKRDERERGREWSIILFGVKVTGRGLNRALRSGLEHLFSNRSTKKNYK